MSLPRRAPSLAELQPLRQLHAANEGECSYGRCVGLVLLALSIPGSAQQIAASPDQLAAAPLVTVQISEQLRSPPDEASNNAGAESHAPTASAALAANKGKTEHLLAAIKAAGIASKDMQAAGVSVGADYEYETVNGRVSGTLYGIKRATPSASRHGQSTGSSACWTR